MKQIKKILIKGFHRFRRRKSIPVFSELKSHSSVKVRAIGHALYSLVTDDFTENEKQFISLIEKRRISLLNSNEEITIIDYGAGQPGSNRTMEEMHNGVTRTALVSDLASVSKTEFWAAMLLKLIRELQPNSCVELGACVGISASYQASALKMNGKGRLQTLEGSPETARIAEETFTSLGLSEATVIKGPFHQTLDTVIESTPSIDFFFNDGHHDRDAVINNFIKVLPKLTDDAVIVFDDISWSTGMKKAWAEIEDHERVLVSIDLGPVGIAVLGDDQPNKLKLRTPL